MTEIVKRSFTSGELSPELRVRVDLGKYQSGLARCKNMFCKSQGGVFSRPGLRYVGDGGNDVLSSYRAIRLIPFSFNTEQTYALVFSHHAIKIIKNGGYIMSLPGVPRLVVSPYAHDELADISYSQSADVLTLTHPKYDPMNLSRTSEEFWTLDTIQFTSTMPPPASVILTIEGSVPDPTTGDETAGGDFKKSYYYKIAAVDEDSDSESIPSVMVSHNVRSYTATYGGRLTWSAVAGADYYRIYKGSSGNNDVFGLIGESRTLTFDDFNIAPDLSFAPQKERDPFSGVGNKPSAVNYYQQRQVFASTINQPQTLFTTQTGNFSSLRTSSPARSDDAVTLTVANRQVNEIRHIIALDELILLTSGGEWKVTEGNDEVLAPDTVGVRMQSSNGSSKVVPAVINDTVVYVQNKGSTVRDLGSTFTSDKYSGNDLSIMSKHLFEGDEIIDMAYAAEPNGILWCVMKSGRLAAMTYQREHKVWGWHWHETNGKFESVVSVSEGTRDAVYFVVARKINGLDKKFIERLEMREEISSEDCFYVDSGLSYSGAPVTTVTGIDHLENETVSVLADGMEYTAKVANGSITLPKEHSKIHVGLPYESEIITLPIDDPQASIRSKVKSVESVNIIFHRTRGGFVGPVNDIEDASLLDSELTEIKPRKISYGYGVMPLSSGKIKIAIKPGWNDDGMIRVVQKSPLPMAILAIIPSVSIGGS